MKNGMDCETFHFIFIVPAKSIKRFLLEQFGHYSRMFQPPFFRTRISRDRWEIKRFFFLNSFLSNGDSFYFSFGHKSNANGRTHFYGNFQHQSDRTERRPPNDTELKYEKTITLEIRRHRVQLRPRYWWCESNWKTRARNELLTRNHVHNGGKKNTKKNSPLCYFVTGRGDVPPRSSRTRVASSSRTVSPSRRETSAAGETMASVSLMRSRNSQMCSSSATDWTACLTVHFPAYVICWNVKETHGIS